jgi:hypothetical protein
LAAYWQLGAVPHHWRQHRSNGSLPVAQQQQQQQQAAIWQRNSGGHGCGSHRHHHAATAVLPPRTATVAMNTPAVPALAGAQATINNQLKAAMAMVTKMVTMTAMMITMETKGTMVAAEARWQRGGNSQLGGFGGSLARAWLIWREEKRTKNIDGK